MGKKGGTGGHGTTTKVRRASRVSEGSPPCPAPPHGPGRPLLGMPSPSSRCRPPKGTVATEAARPSAPQARETRLGQQGPPAPPPSVTRRSPAGPRATPPQPGARRPPGAGPASRTSLPLTGCRSRSYPAPPSGPKLLARVSLSDLISGLGRRGGAASKGGAGYKRGHTPRPALPPCAAPTSAPRWAGRRETRKWGWRQRRTEWDA